MPPKPASSDRSSDRKADRHRLRLTEALLVVGLALQVLLLVALVLHGPGAGAPKGLVGHVGVFAAAMVYGTFGVLSYLLVALGLWTTALRLARREITAPRWRAAGFVLFVVGGCTLVHQFFPASVVGGSRPALFGYEPGGAVGAVSFSIFEPAFGSIGTFLFSVVLLCTGLAFATDWLLYEMAWSAIRRTTCVFGLLKRFWPEPVVATSGGALDGDPAPAARDHAAPSPVTARALATSTLAFPAPARPTGNAPTPSAPPASASPPAPFELDDPPIDPDMPDDAADEVSAPATVAPALAAPSAGPSATRDDSARYDIDAGDADPFAFDDPVIEVPPELNDRLAPVPAAPAPDPTARAAAPAQAGPAAGARTSPGGTATTTLAPVSTTSERGAAPAPSAPDADDDALDAPSHPSSFGDDLADAPSDDDAPFDLRADGDDAPPDGDPDDGNGDLPPDGGAALTPLPRLARTSTPAAPSHAKRYRLQGLKVERPRKEGEYEFPTHDVLERPKPRNLRQLEQAIQANADVLARTLTEFKIEGQVVGYQQGPVVTMLEVALAPGTKVTKIHSLSEDLAMALKAESVRVVAPIPGKSTVGVEIPNPVRDDVRMLSLLESPEYRASKAAIPILLGAAADGRPLIEDLASMPHLLIAGSTGSGKSVCINTLLLSILMTRTPDEVRLILIDPKQVELAFFADVPHLLAPVVTDMKRAAAVLEWALDKMEERYDLFRRFEVRNIAGYNELGEEAIVKRARELEMDDEIVHVRLPYVVIVVDELADLMLTVGKDIETAVTRLAQKSRAVGIHVVLATQRPSTDVITGLIKANMPTRIAFKVASKVDSRVILDQNGAEKLLGMGDMLYMPPRSSTIGRAQGTYASDREVKRVVGFLRERTTQEFSDELTHLSTGPMLDQSEKDELYDQAVRIVLGEQRGSASLLQRALSIGYTRASRLLDLMRAEGVVGAYKGSKASEVTMTLEDYEARVASQGGRSSQDDESGDL